MIRGRAAWRGWAFLTLGLGWGCAVSSDSRLLSSGELAREILAELVGIDTTVATAGAAESVARRLRDAGFALDRVELLGPTPEKMNLVARLPGNGRARPILLLAHLDVVPARKEDWSFDPFELIERDGYFYGRGVLDDKAMAAIWIANLIRYHRDGFPPDRDIIVALTADEEVGGRDGVEWLLAHHRDRIDAELCLNEGGGGLMRNGRPLMNKVQVSEKMYWSFRVEVKGEGGHSSTPGSQNAIYRLARALGRLAELEFPARPGAVTSGYFQRMAEVEPEPLANDLRAAVASPPDPRALGRLGRHPYYNALIRTTCVPTRLEAGHADNALPQRASALVNCRILPEDSPQEVRASLTRALRDPRIRIEPIGEPRPSPPSPLPPDVLAAIERTSDAFWPGIPVVPVMSAGSTDGLHLRRGGIPTYGVSGLFADAGDNRAHGNDERIGVRSFLDAQEFLYRLVKELATPGGKTDGT